MRKFRAIVETLKEPEDKEVLWYYKKVLYYYNNGNWEKFVADASIENITLTADKVSYQNDDNLDITNVQEALDKLLYVEPKITSFTVPQAGIYENGTVLTNFDFSWKLNKSVVKQTLQWGSQSTYNVPVKSNNITIGAVRQSTDITFTLTVTDIKSNTASASANVKFVDYIYYGSLKNDNYTKLGKIPGTSNSFNVDIGEGENLWIFIPNSSGYKKIVFNNTDSTNDFGSTSISYATDINTKVSGLRYVSNNTSFGSITLTLQK